MTPAPRFAECHCSQCGASIGPGNSGVSRCADHRPIDSTSVDDWDLDGDTCLVTWSFLYDAMPRVSVVELEYDSESRCYIPHGDAPDNVLEFAARHAMHDAEDRWDASREAAAELRAESRMTSRWF